MNINICSGLFLSHYIHRKLYSLCFFHNLFCFGNIFSGCYSCICFLLWLLAVDFQSTQKIYLSPNSCSICILKRSVIAARRKPAVVIVHTCACKDHFTTWAVRLGILWGLETLTWRDMAVMIGQPRWETLWLWKCLFCKTLIYLEKIEWL